MKIQKEISKSFNFLGRKRIKQKEELFSAKTLERIDRDVKIQFNYDFDAIYKSVKIDPRIISSELILDVFVLGNLTRINLGKSQKTIDYIISDVPDGSNLELRLKIISVDKNELGRIFAATANKMSLKSKDDGSENDSSTSSSGILKFEQSDELNGRLVHVDWSPDSDIDVKIDRIFYEKYNDKPLFRAAIYPDLIRSIAIQLISHHEELDQLDESSTAYFWLKYFNDKLDLPLLGQDSIFQSGEISEAPQAVNTIVETFMGKHWHGKKTILEEFLSGS
jgi:hypothetical protein